VQQPEQPERRDHQRQSRDVEVLDRLLETGTREDERRRPPVLGPDGDQRLVLRELIYRIERKEEVRRVALG
jgi:hypothetical protein